MPASAVPAHAALLRDFANTVDVSEAVDELTTPGQLHGWLHARGLLVDFGSPEYSEGTTRPRDGDLTLARDLREAVRAAFRANHDRTPSPDLARVAQRLPMRLTLAESGPHLSPVEPGVRGALTRLLVAVADAGADGSWPRLKICADDECAWAFYDTSKNRSKTWCSMQVCGNRNKTRTYRARRRPGGAGPDDDTADVP